jgi:hypothetical protein
LSDEWITNLHVDPLPRLLGVRIKPLAYQVRCDLLGEDAGAASIPWEMCPALALLQKQQPDGSWRYPGKMRAAGTPTNYDLLETYRTLRELVDVWGLDRTHPALQRAAGYVLSCQTAEGDIRGILGNQTMPYYHAVLLELLIRAGYAEDGRVARGMEWLLAMRQDDGGWLIPAQAVPAKGKTEAMWRGPSLLPDRTLPFSHLATGMVLRAFAAHPRYRRAPEARLAAERLKSRFFQRDRYNDRQGVEYWYKLQYPFWWPNILTALDSLSLLGFTRDDPDMRKGLDWFAAQQQEDGLWPTGFDKGRKADANRLWVGLAACRVLKRLWES